MTGKHFFKTVNRGKIKIKTRHVRNYLYQNVHAPVLGFKNISETMQLVFKTVFRTQLS